MTNHPNRSRRRDNPAANPTPEQVRALRESVQTNKGVNITSAQDICAAATFTTRRVWQQWEAGDRRMHPAFWYCAQRRTR